MTLRIDPATPMRTQSRLMRWFLSSLIGHVCFWLAIWGLPFASLFLIRKYAFNVSLVDWPYLLIISAISAAAIGVIMWFGFVVPLAKRLNAARASNKG
jgi:hypothetical protein